jgi:Trk K+ transport system NAD-binding subunit
MYKVFPAQISALIRSGASRRNLQILMRLVLVLALMIAVYSVLFHILMEREGQYYSWITGLYWTLTVMTTLGFGDITFHTDLGRIFSIVVLTSGLLFLLILLPFTFIQFFYEPWMRAQAEQRAPRQLPQDTRDHVILTHHDEVAAALIQRLVQFQHPYVLLVPDIDEAVRLHDEGLRVALGELDEPTTYQRMRVDRAALVATTASDTVNTNVAFNVRGVCESVPIAATASDEASVDILELAGSNEVLRLEEMLGQSFARRTMGGDAVAHVMGQFGELMIAEATARRTPLAGKLLRDTKLRENIGVTVLGVWDQGAFQPARVDTVINKNTVLVLAGSREHIDRYNEIYLIYNVSIEPVLIIGGGRVGRATARALVERGTDYRVVERIPERIRDPEKYIMGNAADLETLKKAGIDRAPTVIITTHDDDMNVYLTVYCRRLRPDVQILSRAKFERTVPTLHRAGADMVMSYASMGASAILNMLRGDTTLMLEEGLDLIEVPIPERLAGRSLADSTMREKTGCSVVAIRRGTDMEISPDPYTPLPREGELLLIGAREAEARFLEQYGS